MTTHFNTPWDIAEKAAAGIGADSTKGASESRRFAVDRIQPPLVQAAIAPKAAGDGQSRPNSPSHLDRIYAMCESFGVDLANLVSAVASAVASFFGCSSRPPENDSDHPLAVFGSARDELPTQGIESTSATSEGGAVYPKEAQPKRVTYTSLAEYQEKMSQYETNRQKDPFPILIENLVNIADPLKYSEHTQAQYRQLGIQQETIINLLKMERDPEETQAWPNDWKDFLTKDLLDCQARMCSLGGEIDILIGFFYSRQTSTPLAQFKEDLSTLYAQTPLEGLEKELSKLRNGYAETVEKLKGLKNPTGLSELLISKYQIEEKKLKLQEHLHEKADAELEKLNAEPKSEAAAIEKSTFNTDKIRQAVCGGLNIGSSAIRDLFVSDPSSSVPKEGKVSLMSSFPSAAQWAASWTTEKPVGDSREQKPKPLILAEELI